MSALLLRSLQSRLGGSWRLAELGVSGFCSTWRADGDSGCCFVKSLPLSHAATLQAEADGLQALAATGCVHVPAVVDVQADTATGFAWLAMAWLDLVPAGPGFGERLGRALGRLHRQVPTEGGGCFGWRRDNRLGPTPQPNDWSATGGLDGWLAFFGGRRLGALNARLAAEPRFGPLAAAVDGVIARLPDFFDDGHRPRPSLLHGDLWLGNVGALAGGEPVLYDPAVSVGDAEMELALLTLFGTPPVGFWAAYAEVAGLAPGFERRRPLYQLYHLMNHALIFGAGYTRQALAVAQALRRGG